MKIERNKYNHVVIKIEDLIDLDKEDVAWAAQAVLKLQAKAIKLIIDLNKGYVNLTQEAINYLSTHAIHKEIAAMGIVLKSLPNRILANSFVRNNNFQYPAIVFETRPKAEDWLQTISDSHLKAELDSPCTP